MIIDRELSKLADFTSDYSRARKRFVQLEDGEGPLLSSLQIVIPKIDNVASSSITLARRYLFNVGHRYPELMLELHEELELTAARGLEVPELDMDTRVSSAIALVQSRYLRNQNGMVAECHAVPFSGLMDQARKQNSQSKDIGFAGAIGSAALLAIVIDQPKVAKEFLSLRKSFKFFPKAEKLLRSLADFADAQSTKSPNEPLEIDQATHDLFFWIFNDYRTCYRTEKPELMFSADAIQLCNSDPGCILLADFYLRRLSSKPSPVPSFDDVKRLVTWKGI
jgi:hypothetical protein